MCDAGNERVKCAAAWRMRAFNFNVRQKYNCITNVCILYIWQSLNNSKWLFDMVKLNIWLALKFYMCIHLSES
jgi:hypothetical protein